MEDARLSMFVRVNDSLTVADDITRIFLFDSVDLMCCTAIGKVKQGERLVPQSSSSLASASDVDM